MEPASPCTDKKKHMYLKSDCAMRVVAPFNVRHDQHAHDSPPLPKKMNQFFACSIDSLSLTEPLTTCGTGTPMICSTTLTVFTHEVWQLMDVQHWHIQVLLRDSTPRVTT